MIKGVLQQFTGLSFLTWGVYQLFGLIGIQWLMFIAFSLYGIVMIILGGINIVENK
jgi:hypothetical protein